MARIPRVTAGKAPTLLSAALANKLIDVVNALSQLQVQPHGMGKFVMGEANSIIDIAPLVERIETIEKRQKEIEKRVTDVETEVTDILTRINAPQATAVCNSDGTITITFVI